jgi:glutathione S-transferase
MLKLYGTRMSRAARSLWALEELGLKYEHVPLNTQGDSRKPEYLKVNPNGHVPALEDDGLTVWESMAINLYLAEKYGKAPSGPPAQISMRSLSMELWGMTEIDPLMAVLVMKGIFLPPDQRDEKAVAQALERIKAPLKSSMTRSRDTDIWAMSSLSPTLTWRP